MALSHSGTNRGPWRRRHS